MRKRKGGKQKFRVPEILPKISFFEAYKKLGIDLGVKHIEVIYLYDSEIRDGKEVLVPVWDFDCYGGELRSSGPKVTIGSESKPKEYLTVMKEFRIDVITGEKGPFSEGRI